MTAPSGGLWSTGLIGHLGRQPVLLLTLTALFWAGNAIAGQIAVGEVAPFQLVFLRWALVALLLWPIFGAEVRAGWPVIRPRLTQVIAMAALGFTTFNGLFYFASQYTSAVNIGILQGAIPVFVLIGAFLQHKTPVGLLQAAGVLVTLAGVALVATGGAPWRLADLSLNVGDVMMLAAGALYAFYTIQLQGRPAIGGAAFFTLMTIVAAVTALPFMIAEALIVGPPLPSPTGWLVVAYVTLFPSCFAQLFFLRGVDLIGPGRAGVFMNLVPVFAAGLAIVLLGQAFEAYHAVSLVAVLGGIWLAQRGR